MLPSNLLIARKYGDTIRPVYARIDERSLDVAERLIQTYKEHVGEKKAHLQRIVDRLENMGHDYRFIRGLSTLLERRCEFRCKTAVDPIQARRRVFQLVAERGVPTTDEDRQEILEEVARMLGVTAEQLEQSLYGDLEDEQILYGFNPPRAEKLVKQYNLSLTQTLLFRSTEMEFTASGNWQIIFRQIKWLSLIYTIQKDGEHYRVRVDGPVSLFKLNRRYGTSLAKLVPHIVVNPEWTIRAKILRRKGERRLLNLKLDSRKHGAYLESTHPPQEMQYDSLVEQDFARRFEALKTGWELTREPEPIPVGRHVMIPDFSFQKAGFRVYMEVAGFWTPGYLKHKLRQLSLVREVDMIVAADRQLACEKLDRMGRRLDVVYYKGQVPLKPILHHLREREKKLVEQQVERLQREELKVEEPVVTVQELAIRLGVLEEAAKRLLRERVIPGYKALGDMLIKPSRLERIEKEMEKRTVTEQLTLSEATKLVKELGGRGTTAILEALGYRIQWHGIDPDKAIIQKKTNTPASHVEQNGSEPSLEHT